MSDLEYCPECGTYIGPGPSDRTDCPECGADLVDLAPFDEGDETAPEIGDDRDDDPNDGETGPGEAW